MATQTGLSEVRFTYVPAQARAPQPATGATGVALNATLNWRPGREATSHKVYLGTDQTPWPGEPLLPRPSPITALTPARSLRHDLLLEGR